MGFYLPIIITMVFFGLQARGIQKGILWASFSVALLYMILVFKIVLKYDWAVILGLCCICFWAMFRAAWATQPKY